MCEENSKIAGKFILVTVEENVRKLAVVTDTNTTKWTTIYDFYYSHSRLKNTPLICIIHNYSYFILIIHYTKKNHIRKNIYK